MVSTGAPPVALLLAAGKGTRMNSRHPKAVHRLLGKPMGRYAADLALRLGVERVVAVVGHGAEAVREALGADLEYVEQGEPRGTGHAVAAAAPLLAEHQGPLLVLQADNVLLTDETVAELLARHQETGAAATLLTTVLEQPGSYGRILRSEGGAVSRIVEAKGAPEEVLALGEINAGCYVFSAPRLFEALRGLRPDPTTGELYLTDAIQLLAGRGERVEAVVADDPTVALGVNTRVELAEAAALLRGRLLREHMLNGVTIEDPATTYVEADVRIGRDTVLRPMTYLCGRTLLGEECDVGPVVRITDCVLGDRVSVQNAVLAQSEVGEETRIGPFAQLRPGCKLGRKVKIGNFVELKNAEVEDRASVGHLAYIGDAFVGEKTNIGAGTITCNYDGKRKHQTRIGRNTFIGSHATLIAPVVVGEGGFVAAGTVVTQDVPPDALAVGRARQENKPGWARKRREREG
jgi:bifunctional UDP-N-acetylglucosamine pyrophosphorylase/glucosamine-1-phosphate N-acetyltransferase